VTKAPRNPAAKPKAELTGIMYFILASVKSRRMELVSLYMIPLESSSSSTGNLWQARRPKQARTEMTVYVMKTMTQLVRVG
jgi:hypothetical protein